MNSVVINLQKVRLSLSH